MSEQTNEQGKPSSSHQGLQNITTLNNSVIQGQAAMQQSIPEDKSVSGSSFNDGFQILQAAQIQESLSETDWTVSDGEPPKPDSSNAGQGTIEDTTLEDDQQHEEPQKPPLTTRGRLVLEDYDIQLRLLEAQNKRRLEMARQEQAKHVVPSSHIHSPPQPMSPAVMGTMKGHPAMAIRNTMGTMSPNQPNPYQTIIMLQAQVKALQDENQRLQRQLLDAKKATFAVFHCVTGEDGAKIYLDQPRWVRWGDKFVLEAYSPVLYPEGYGLYKSLHFVVYKTYSKHTCSLTKKTSQQVIECPTPFFEPDRETVRLVSEELMTAMEKLAERDEATQKKPSCLVSDKEILAPHLWWYCYRSRGDMLDGLTPSQAEAMQSLMRWMDEAYSKSHSQADDHFKRGMVSASSMGYFIQPGDVLLCSVEGGFEARLATSWLQDMEVAQKPSTQGPDEVRPVTDGKVSKRRWEVDAWSYRYDGNFYRMTTRPSIQLDVDTMQDVEISIADLGVFPLRFASQEMRDTLARRGKTFWECRNGKHVSYGTKDKSYTPEQRYMIDCQTYSDLHPGSEDIRLSREDLRISKVEPAFIDQKDAPSEPDLYLFPRAVMGYDLRRKRWEKVDVDHIREIAWNGKAFDQLIAEPETKDLIMNVLGSQLSLQTQSGVRDSKYNGFTMLMRGASGTGKTFTAESVADFFEKPLCTVRCSDVGTTPEDVQKHLEDIFHLAKTWGCIVLLVEAEVFLERRNVNDVAQNARVSAFLRALDDYKGILILESNRLARLDEAFNSCIQLPLHYEPLTEPGRTYIWHNLLDNIQSLDKQAMDIRDAYGYTDELARLELNGHQMHQVVTTARQLAGLRLEKMTSRHLSLAAKSFHSL